MTAEELELLEGMFGGAEVLTGGDICDYFDAIRDAYNIHVDKERIRNGLWKDYPAEDQCNQIKIKIDRIVRSLERLQAYKEHGTGIPRMLVDNITEELLDIINYAVFATRIVNGKVS